jgi:hypothetical protein
MLTYPRGQGSNRGLRPAIGHLSGELQEPLGSEISVMPAVPDTRKTTARVTFGQEHIIRPFVQISLGRGSGEDAHRTAHHGTVVLAKGQNPTCQTAHWGGPGRCERAHNDRRRGQGAMIDGGDQAGAEQVRFLFGGRLSAPQTEQHPRKRLAADRFVERHTAHEHVLIRRGGDGR